MVNEQLEKLKCSEEYRQLQESENDFNILTIFEDVFHENSYSRIIAFLCSSNNKHNLGQRFFREWMKQIKNIKLPPSNSCYVQTYFNWSTQNGRYLDILIELVDIFDGRVTNVIGVENKIFSGEQTDQIADYQKALCQAYPESGKKIIFLSPDGREAYTAELKLYKDCQCIPASYVTFAKPCAKSYSKIESQVEILLKSLGKYIESNLIGGGGVKTKAKNLVRKLYHNPEHSEAIQNILKYSPFQPNIRSLIFEQLLPQIRYELDYINIDWFFPKNTTRPKEFNFDVNDINEFVSNMKMNIYYMLISDKEEPDIDRDFYLRLMAFCNKGDNSKRIKGSVEFVNLIKSSNILPENKTSPREWMPWKCLWSGSKYTLTRLSSFYGRAD